MSSCSNGCFRWLCGGHASTSRSNTSPEAPAAEELSAWAANYYGSVGPLADPALKSSAVCVKNTEDPEDDDDDNCAALDSLLQEVGGVHNAQNSEQQDAVDFLEQMLGSSHLGKQASDPSRALYDACWEGDFESAFNALEKGADTSKGFGIRQNTALHVAARTGHPQLVGMLLRQGAPPSARNSDGETPLFGAITEGNVAATQSLVEARADVNAKDDVGETPLDIARKRERQDFVNFLLKNGAHD